MFQALLDGGGHGLRREELLVFLLLVVVFKTLEAKRLRGVDALDGLLRLGHLLNKGIDALADGLDPLGRAGGVLDEPLKQLCGEREEERHLLQKAAARRVVDGRDEPGLLGAHLKGDGRELGGRSDDSL